MPTASAGSSETIGSTNEQSPQVNVAKAEAEFESLRRELSRRSSLYRTATGQRDYEKEGAGEGDEHPADFDLLEYMRSSQSSHDEHGFKRKHIGVIWDTLCVKGAGGFKVSAILPAFPANVRAS